MQRVYLDNAATTPLNSKVIEKMLFSLQNNYGNPSSTHSYGRESKGALEDSRRKIAQLVGAKPSEIIFTSCGTESNNMILKNAICDLGVQRILVTKTEHPSVKKTVECLSSQVEVVYIPIDTYGAMNLKDLESALQSSDKKTLISAMHANNEVGILNNIEAIGQLAHQYHALFHTDMVQTVGHIPVSYKDMNIDFSAASAHKFHGPKGVGFLFMKQSNKLSPYISGGSQERGYRSGTENLSSIVGMAEALEIAVQGIEEDTKQVTELRQYMADQLLKNVPGLQIITNLNNSLYTVLSVLFPTEMSNDMLPFQLDLKGIACSSGSACSSGADKGSHVIEALGIDPTRKVIRFSFSKYNTKEEIDFAIRQIKELYQEMTSQKAN